MTIIKKEDIIHDPCDRTEKVHMGYITWTDEKGVKRRFQEVHFVCPNDGTHFTSWETNSQCLRIHIHPEYCGTCPTCERDGRRGANAYVTGKCVDGIVSNKAIIVGGET